MLSAGTRLQPYVARKAVFITRGTWTALTLRVAASRNGGISFAPGPCHQCHKTNEQGLRGFARDDVLALSPGSPRGAGRSQRVPRPNGSTPFYFAEKPPYTTLIDSGSILWTTCEDIHRRVASRR